MEALRILLVDDHLLFRKGLARLLGAQPDFEVVGEAADGQEAVEQAQLLHPDLVLMDIRMPNCDGLEATRRIKAYMPDVRVVMLSVSDDEGDLVTAVRYGADGYLLKDLLPETLFQQLRGLMAGEAPMSRAIWRLAMHPTVFVNSVDTTSARLSQYVIWNVWVEKKRQHAWHW